MKITSALFSACVVNKESIPDDNLPVVALAGRSNVGKSSLINAITCRKELARTSSLPGKTLTINFYKINEDFYIVDLPGYGYAKASKNTRKKIQVMMDDFFCCCKNLKGVIQILDIRHEPNKLDLQMAQWLRGQKINYNVILTKSDKLGNNQIKKMASKIAKVTGTNSLLVFSARDRSGVEEVLETIHKLKAGQGSKEPSKQAKPTDDKKNDISQKKVEKNTNTKPTADHKKTDKKMTPNANKNSKKNAFKKQTRKKAKK